MKLGQLINPGFVAALNDLNNKDLPAAAAYKLGKITSRAAEEQKAYQEARKALLDKYATKNEDGSIKTVVKDNQSFVVFDGNLEAYTQEIKELNEQEVDMPSISIAVLEKAGTHFTAREMNDLGDLISE